MNILTLLQSKKKFLINLLKSKSKISFIRLVEDNPLKILVIYNFLAMLELIQESKIKLSLGNGMNNFLDSEILTTEKEINFYLSIFI